MTSTEPVRISKANKKELTKTAGLLMMRLGREVTLDEALTEIIKSAQKAKIDIVEQS